MDDRILIISWLKDNIKAYSWAGTQLHRWCNRKERMGTARLHPPSGREFHRFMLFSSTRFSSSGNPPSHSQYLPSRTWMPTLLSLYLHFVVMLGVGVRPCPTIGTDHVPSMTQITETESIVSWSYDVSMAHSNSHPVGTAFFDFEEECLNFAALLKTWIHDWKFVSRGIGRFDMILWKDLNVVVLVGGRKFEVRTTLPYVGAIDGLL